MAYTQCIGAVAPAPECCAVALSEPVERQGGGVPAAAGPDRARKLQARPVPAVGGAALLLGLLVSALVAWPWPGSAPAWPDWAAPLSAFLGASGGLAIAPALAAAFALGLADDLSRGRLRPAWKLLGQLAVGAVLTWPLLARGELAPALAWTALAVTALNALNTFDNADGAAPGLGLVGFLGSSPVLFGVLLGFLPFNLLGRRPRGGGPLLPAAYLGDAGSHLLGMMILLTPAAWPVLVLPLLDLARLSLLRASIGQAPWVGDRRHLAHRLADLGLDRLSVMGVLLLIAAPAVGGAAVGLLWPGIAATCGLFGLAVTFSRAPQPERA